MNENEIKKPKGTLLMDEWADLFEDLTMEQRGRVLTAIFEHHKGVTHDFGTDKESKLVFRFIAGCIDRYDEKYVEDRFGGMLNAFKFGAPPHAGCAFGLERIFMVLNNSKNIRDIVAFPKNGSGVDLMMNSPAEVDKKLLDDTYIAVVPPEED